MAKIRTIVFDLGAVLVDWNPRYAFRTLGAPDEKIEIFLREVATGDWNLTLDAGEKFATAIARRAEKFPEWAEWLGWWHREWPTMLKGTIPGSVELLDHLAGLRDRGELEGIYALSNWSSETFDIARARFPFLEKFDALLISGEERLVKPDPKFFKLLESRYGVNPAEALFIDDVALNVQAGAGLGFMTHHFKSPEGLRQALIDHKLLK